MMLSFTCVFAEACLKSTKRGSSIIAPKTPACSIADVNSPLAAELAKKP